MPSILILLPAGPPGHNGAPGLHGPPGPSGPAGQKGGRGPPGLKGSSGPAGQKGDGGPRGPPGPTGPKGNRGSTGSRGSTGPSGQKGATGPRGLTGQKGQASFGGSKGQKGERGLCPLSDCGNRNCDFPCYRRKRESDTDDDDAVIETDMHGVVYTRWGESICSENTKIIYSGTTVSGLSGNNLCLPPFQHPGGMKHAPIDKQSNADPEATSLYQNEIPCSVCLALKHSTVLTISGKITCPTGWTREYIGHLMTGSTDGNGQFYCVDYNHLMRPNHGDHERAKFTQVKVDCNGSLAEHCHSSLKCAVCTW